jgi:hypothetical protein
MKQIKYNSFLTLHFRARNATQGFERVHVLVFVVLFVLVRLAALQVLVRVRVPQRLRLERRVLGLEILFVLEYGTLPRPPVGTSNDNRRTFIFFLIFAETVTSACKTRFFKSYSFGRDIQVLNISMLTDWALKG